MRIVSGVDLVEVDRLRGKSDGFMRRVYTPGERERAVSTESLAGLWAVKEAVAKALGTGIGAVSFQEIEVLKDANNKPILQLSGFGRSACCGQQSHRLVDQYFSHQNARCSARYRHTA